MSRLRFAIADPPYLGCARKHYRYLHPDAAAFDRLETHADLIQRLCAEFDGWALHLHAPSLARILPLCPRRTRVAAWVKPFASFKPAIAPAYAWEPVLVFGGRRPQRSEPSGRDWFACPMARESYIGAKPLPVVWWILTDLLHARPSDTVRDLFPGSGAVGRAVRAWRASERMRQTRQLELVG